MSDEPLRLKLAADHCGLCGSTFVALRVEPTVLIEPCCEELARLLSCGERHAGTREASSRTAESVTDALHER